MKLKAGFFSKLNIQKLLLKNLYKLVIIILLLILIYLVYYIYQNLYLVVIKPKEIKSEEISAKQEKINLTLFEDVTKKIDEKKSSSNEDLSKLNNPF